VRVKYGSLPNLILNREVFPELIQDKAKAEFFAARLRPWLAPGPEGDAALAAARAELADLRAKVGGPGAAKRAAAIILNDISQNDISQHGLASQGL